MARDQRRGWREGGWVAVREGLSRLGCCFGGLGSWEFHGALAAWVRMVGAVFP